MPMPESDQDRPARILANVSLPFSLPTLRLRFCILRGASKLFSLGFARLSKLTCLLLCGLTDIFYRRAPLDEVCVLR
jgi:hypothetical protein